MRIEKIRLRNLNSLAGEWTVDFTCPEYAVEGLFAITGPTGAGKSTILDAISLGLYGCTPRLGKLSKNDNEIISSRAGDCLAEVTFSTQKGRFRSCWSQRRARKKPDGELQPPRHELADAETGEVLETRIRDVLRRIEEVTGMDYERFSRSMLLPQGRFADFLMADPDGRAPLLEQITGTEIYRDISIEVHKRMVTESKRVGALANELKSFHLMTEEEEAAVSALIAEKTARLDAVAAELGKREKSLAWLENIARLREQAVETAAALGKKEEEDAAFQPERDRLARAEKALELAAAQSLLGSGRGELRREEDAAAGCDAALPGLRERAETTAAAHAEAERTLSLRRGEREARAPLHTRVRALDVTLREKDAPLRQVREKAAQLGKILTGFRERFATKTRAHEEKSAALSSLAEEMRASERDAELAERLPAWQAVFARFGETSASLAARRSELVEAKKEALGANAEWLRRDDVLRSARAAHDALRRDHAEKEKAIAELLGGIGEADWSARRDRLERRGGLFAQMESATAALGAIAEEAKAFDETKRVAEARIAALRGRRTKLDETALALEEKTRLLEENLHLAQQIHSLADARGQLRDGAPCPLCGALEHPFALGNVPAPDGAKARLDAARRELAAVAASLSELRVELARQEKDRDQAARSAADADGRRLAATRDLEMACRELDLDYADAETPRRALALREENDRALAAAKTTLARLQALRDDIARMGDLSASLARLHALENDLKDADHRKELSSRTVVRLEGETGELAEAAQAILDELRGEISRFASAAFDPDAAGSVLDGLVARRDAWRDRTLARTALEKTVATLAVSAEHLRGSIVSAENEEREGSRRLADLEAEYAKIVSERAELFADRDVDEEEKRLADALAEAERAFEDSRRDRDAALSELEQTEARLLRHRSAVDSRRAALAAAEADFLASARDKGFADEADYLAALLGEAERSALRARADALAAEKKELATLEREIRARLAAETALNLTDEPAERLAAAIGGCRAESSQLQRDIGAYDERLRANAEAGSRRRERLAAFEAQQREYSRWEKLHALIGSHDGAKFRNFAQGITFEIMVGHANRQLARMTDRYILVRDPLQPLSLNVLDAYQAGRRRSTRNLSGGETFIVSLALALGLSTMASRNVKVDSLFLDEGFGSLDAETLDIALETLGQLHSEGKLIGAISHIPEVKDRIPTHIVLTPLPNGDSLMEGPGCSRGGPALTASPSSP